LTSTNIHYVGYGFFDYDDYDDNYQIYGCSQIGYDYLPVNASHQLGKLSTLCCTLNLRTNMKGMYENFKFFWHGSCNNKCKYLICSTWCTS